jgi:molybdate transport system substrate-binding protein
MAQQRSERIQRSAGALLAVMVVFSTLTHAAELTVLCSNGLRAVLSEVAPEFERTSGHRLVISYSVSAELKKRIDAGERFDIAILTPVLVDELTAAGALRADTRRTVARSGMGVSVRRGAQKPDLRTIEALKVTLLAARSIAFAKEGAGGLFFMALIQRFGLSDQLVPRFRPVVTGQDVSRAVANGDAEIGVQPISEILNMAGVELAGSFPAAVQGYSVMMAAVGVKSPHPDAGRALIDFLMSRELDAVVRERGMERLPE